MPTHNESTRHKGGKPRGEPVVRKVFEVALQHLAARGYHALSVPEVAAEAGLNKTSVYRRWPSKAELVGAALGAALGNAEPPPDTGNLRDDVLQLAHRGLRFAQSTVGKSVLRTLLAEGGDGEAGSIAGELIRRHHGSGAHAVLRRGIARGELAPDTDVRLLLSVIAGTLMQRILIERGRVTRRELERLVDLVLYGASTR
jgi:AcrR family transcriptional regulator